MWSGAPLMLMLALLIGEVAYTTEGQGISTATNHHVDYARLGMTPPADGRKIEQPDNLYERDVALPSPGMLECTNSQAPRDPLAGVADYSLKKLNALLDEAGVDRTRLMRKEQVVENARAVLAERLGPEWMARAGTGATWTCAQ